jgi:large subunit ribosomal protein L25
MEKVTLTLKPRDITGKQVKQLRKDGMVPAVIHDHGKDSVVVMGSFIDVSKVYQKAGRNHPVTIKAGDKQYTALIKDAAFDPKKNRLTHVVFNAVKANQKVDAEVPVRIKLPEEHEVTPAERNGLVVLNQLEAVEVEALPRYLPEAIYFDGEKLAEAGDSATVADLIVPEHVEITTDPSHPVATVFEPSALQAANEEAAGEAEEAEPEAEAEEGKAEEAEGTEATESESAASKEDQKAKE